MVVWAHVVCIGSEEADIGVPSDECSNEHRDTYETYDSGQDYGVTLDICVNERGGRPDAENLYRCSIVTPEIIQKHSYLSRFGRGYYIVNELTPGTLRGAVAEITTKINSTWGENWREVSLKLSWYAIGEFEFIDNQEPALNPDGTVNFSIGYYYSAPDNIEDLNDVEDVENESE